MCNAFAKSGRQVVLALEGNGTDFKTELNNFINNSFSDKLIFKVINWERKTSNSLLNRFLIISQIELILDKEKPDLVFTRESIFLKTILKKSFPVVYESHNAKLHSKYYLIHKIFLNQIKRAARGRDFLCLFTISKSLSDFWKNQGIPDSKLFTWHDGFDAALFITNHSKKEAREKLGLPLNKVLILYAGGLYKDREIENILKLSEGNTEIQFIIIGGPEKNRRLFENIAKRDSINNVHFTGLIPHKLIPDYLYAADILLALWSDKVPTINYCSPLKLFEYMAAGRLILAHDFPTIREVLEDGKDVIFCQPGNFQSLNSKFSEALTRIGDNYFGVNARNKAFHLYTWDNRVKKLTEFIRF